jgi:hypothetical protein
MERLIQENHGMLKRYNDLEMSLSWRGPIRKVVERVRGERESTDVEVEVLDLMSSNVRKARLDKQPELHWDMLLSGVRKRYNLDLNAEPEIERSIRKMWVDSVQSEMIGSHVLLSDNRWNVVKKKGMYDDILDNYIAQFGSPSYADRAIGDLIRLDTIRRTSKEGVEYDKPLYEQSGDVETWLPRKLYRDGIFVLSGIKDKDRLVARKFLVSRENFERFWHPDKEGSLLQRAWEVDPTLRAEFEAGWKEYLPRTKGDRVLSDAEIAEYRLQFAHLQANEMAALEKLTNFDIISILQGKAGHVLTKIGDLTKRWQVFDAHEVRFDPQYMVKQGFKPEGMRTLVLNATSKDISNFFNKENYHFFTKSDKKVVKRWADAMRDGGDFIRQDVFDAMLKYYGQDPNAGFIKGTLSYSGPDGMIVGKHGNFRAPDSLNKFMLENDIGAFRFNTSVKQRGHIDLKDFYVNEKFELQVVGKDRAPLDLKAEKLHTTPWDGITILSAESLEHATHNVKAPAQLFKNVDDPAINDVIWDAYLKKTYDGSLEANSAYRSYMDAMRAGTSEAELRLLAEKVDLRQLGMQELVDLVGLGRENRIPRHPLFSRYVREVLTRAKDEDFWREDGIVTQDSEAMRQYIAENTSTVEKLLNVMGEVSPAMAMGHPAIRKYLDVVTKNYMVERMTRPLVDGAWHAYLTPMDPFTEARYRPTENMFLVGETMRTHKIPFEGKKVELEKLAARLKELIRQELGDKWKGREWREQWEEYYREVDSGKRTMTDEIAKLNDALEFIVVRVPQDSQAGARVLRFFDFAEGMRGSGVIVHPKNSSNMGGADKDGDKAFMLPGLPKELKDYYRKYQNQWEVDGVVVPDKTSYELLASRQDEWEKQLRRFDPISIVRANKANFENNRQLGPGLNAVNRWKVLWPDISGKWIHAKIPAKMAERFNEKLKWNLPDEALGNMWWSGLGAKSNAKLWSLSKDVINFAADAATSGKMKDRYAIANILGRAAFDKFGVHYRHPQTGKVMTIETRPDDFGPRWYEPYESLTTMDRLRKGRNVAGRSIGSYEMLEGYRDLLLRQKISDSVAQRSSWYRVGKYMAELEAHLNLEAFVGKNFQKILAETEATVREFPAKKDRTADEQLVYESILRRQTKWGDFQAYQKTDYYQRLSPTEKYHTVMDFMWKDGVDVASIRALTALGRQMDKRTRASLLPIGERIEEFKRRYTFVGENIRAARAEAEGRVSATYGDSSDARPVDNYNQIRQDFLNWWNAIVMKQPEPVQRWAAYHTLSTLSVHPETFPTFIRKKFGSGDNPFKEWARIAKEIDLENARRAQVLAKLKRGADRERREVEKIFRDETPVEGIESTELPHEATKRYSRALEVAGELKRLEREYYTTQYKGLGWTLDILPHKYIRGFAEEINKVFDTSFKEVLTQADKKAIAKSANTDDLSEGLLRVVKRDAGTNANIRFHTDKYVAEKTESSIAKFAKEFEGRDFQEFLKAQPEGGSAGGSGLAGEALPDVQELPSPLGELRGYIRRAASA